MNHQEHLINKAIAGDQKAFEELYKSTYKKVHFTCMAFLKNEEDVADIEQDIYIIVLKSLNTLEDKSKFESWLGKITVNKCRDFLKKNKPTLVEDEVLAEAIVEEDELKLPEEYVSNKAKRKILMDIIRDCLSDNLYQTVILFYFHDMSASEIAELMECPVGTITSRLCLARTKIKEAVLAYEKKSGDKLHAIVLVPVLAMLFKEEALAMEPVNICDNILNISSTGITTAKVAKTGGKIMFKSLKMKVVAAVVAATVIAGGIGVALIVNNNKEENEVILEAEDFKEADDEDISGSSSPEVDESLEEGTDDNTETEDGPEITKIGEVLVDNEYVEIVYSGSEWWEERGSYKVYFTITNKLEEEVSVNVNRNFAVNGLHDYPNLYEILAPKETLDCTLFAWDYFIQQAMIDHVDFIDLSFSVYPQESGGLVDERALIVPEESRGLKVQQYQVGEDDEVLIDTEDFLLVITDYEIQYGDLRIYYYAQNNTEFDVCFTTKGRAMINGEYHSLTFGDPFFYAGYAQHGDFHWFSEDYTEVDLETVEFDVVFYKEEFEYDYETGERKELYRQTVTISEIFDKE